LRAARTRNAQEASGNAVFRALDPRHQEARGVAGPRVEQQVAGPGGGPAQLLGSQLHHRGELARGQCIRAPRVDLRHLGAGAGHGVHGAFAALADAAAEAELPALEVAEGPHA